MQTKDRVTMSRKEIARVPVLERLAEGKVTQRAAAQSLGISERQVRRLLRRYESAGGPAITHAGRGRASARRIDDDIRQKVLDLCKGKYQGFGPTFASQKLHDLDDVCVSRETLRKWLLDEGLWKKSQRRKKLYKRRQRRECFGELLQMDGSHHDWLEGRGPKLVLMGFIDDATGKVFGRFYDYEGTGPAMQSLGLYALKYGLPMSVYVDRLSAYNAEGQSQFERAMQGLGVEVIHARTPQAKGRVERSFATHQDRLVKELRLRGISTKDDTNAYLDEYWSAHNERYSVQPASDADAHVAVTQEQLDEHMCIKHERTVRADGTFSYEGRLYMVEGSARGPVEVRVTLAGQMSVRWASQEVDIAEVSERPKKTTSPKPRKQAVTIPDDGHPWKRPIKQLTPGRVWANAY